MTGRAAWLGRLGGALAVGGLAAVVAPVVFAWLPASGATVTVVGLVTLVVGVRGVLTRVREGHSPSDAIPDPRTRTAARVPGADFDRALAAREPVVRDRLREAAVEVLTRCGGVSREAAWEHVERGDWTEDGAAAAFFSPDAAPDPPVADRVQAMLAGRSPGSPVAQAERVVGALAARVGGGLDCVPTLADAPDAASEAGTAHAPGDSAVSDGGVVDGTAVRGGVGAQVTRTTDRWRGVGSLALVAAGGGLVLQSPGLLAVAAVGGVTTAYAAYGRADDPLDVDLSVDRELSDRTPEPGETVQVSVAVQNEGDATVSDLRFVDGVPAALAVESGEPRLDARLAPGESATWTYSVVAETGVHEFEPGVAIARDMAGAREHRALVDAEDALTCTVESDVERATPRDAVQRLPGRVAADTGGAGVEFYGTREYRRGDPMSLVDWKRYARTGELSTVEYREERASSVVLVVDARRVAYAAGTEDGRPVVRRAAEGAATIAEGLLDGGDLVGLAALSPRADDLWVPPGGGGRAHEQRLRDALSTHPAVAPIPPDRPFAPSVAGTRLASRVRSGTELVFVSPVLDDGVVALVETLAARNHAATVVCPVVTARDTPGRLLADVERWIRCSRLRAGGVTVVEWRPDEPLGVALMRGEQRRERP
jgi:uncharacterized repeat protein (TIGR01451 family)